MNEFEHSQKWHVVIAGAGPAGLTAARELQRLGDAEPIVVEMSDAIGGISRTVNYHGNRIDIGGHRFFSKNQRVMRWWQEVMPIQGAPSADDLLLNRQPQCEPGGPNPQTQDRVMLQRNRVSRIFYLRKFFDYPISLKWQTFANMGTWRTAKAGTGYLWAQIHKRRETSLENFYINRFGKPLYSMFFEDYTKKVWGVHPSKLGADWGAQRVKGLSVHTILKDVVMKRFRKNMNNQQVETSLIEQFIYPKYGPGQLWEAVAHDVQVAGGDIRMKQKVVEVHVEHHRVTSVTVCSQDGQRTVVPCDYFLSSMPLKDLVAAIRGVEVPSEVRRIASELPYRDFITVGLLVDKLKIENSTKIKTLYNCVPDTWIYIQERDVKVGRLQVFNNWSPYMVADFEHKVWIGLEYFCSEGDELWNMSDLEFIAMATNELERIGIIDKSDVEDAVRIKVKKAYPSYFGSYYQLDTVKRYLDSIENLFCIGRNGQHRYNNMDHSMLTAIEAVEAIHKGSTDKSAIWSVNTENVYHETKN
jgi:protoporphyrinogen oxidase